MKTTQILLWLTCVSGTDSLGQDAQHEAPPSRGANADQRASHSIPFKLTRDNNISVKVVLNEIDHVELMLHTAVNSVSLTRKAIQRTSSLQFDGMADVESWGGEASARYSTGNSLQIGGLAWTDVSITEGKHSGNFTDGKFGCNLFQGKVVEIDFDQSTLVLHSSVPESLGEYDRFEIEFHHGSMFIEGTVQIGEEEYQNQFLVHSGFSGTVLFDDEFVQRHGLGDKLRRAGERELRDSYGNVLKTSKVIVPSLSFGQAKLLDVPAGLFSGAMGERKMSVVGGDVLKRFNIFIDAEAGYLYMRPNQLAGSDFS